MLRYRGNQLLSGFDFFFLTVRPKVFSFSMGAGFFCAYYLLGVSNA